MPFAALLTALLCAVQLILASPGEAAPARENVSNFQPDDRFSAVGTVWLTSESITFQIADSEALMLDQPVGSISTTSDSRWSATLTDNSAIALAWWAVLLMVLQLTGKGWAAFLFRSFPDRGAGFARILALLTAGYLVWITASLEVIRFRAFWSWIALITVGISGWMVSRHFSERGNTPNATLWNRRDPEVAFWSVFSLFLLFRFINPDSWHPAWGGEKPMEFAHINALLRTGHFPPFDPWYSGGMLNYYYYGEYLVAFLIKLTGIPSEIAFNLAQPTTMALLASGVASVGSNLTGRLARSRGRAWIGGATATVIVIVMGNLIALKNVVEVFPDVPSPSFLDWTWAASRAIPGGITEFPFFTGLYADLHAHVTALPVTVLVIGLALELACRGSLRGKLSVQTVVVDRLPLLLFTALALGTIGAANAWDAPLYAVLVAAAILMSFQPNFRFPTAMAASAVTSLAVAVFAYGLFLPFHANFTAIFSSLDQVRDPSPPGDVLLHLGGLLALLALGLIWIHGDQVDREPKDARQSGLLISAVLVPISVLGAIYVWRELPDTGAAAGFGLAIAALSIGVALWLIGRYFHPGIGSSLAFIAFAAASLLAVVQGWSVLVLGFSVAMAGTTLWLGSRETERRFVGLLIAAGGCAIAGVELVYVVDDLESLEDWYRMNTIFKIYNEVWIVLALAAAAMIGALLAGAFEPPGDVEPADLAAGPAPTPAWLPDLALSRALASVSIAVVAAGLLYPLLATGPRLDLRFPGHPRPGTLNALDWMDYGTITAKSGAVIAFDEDRAVIDWFNSKVNGAPVIAEASIGPYRGNGSRISIATGLPSVLGWDRHERQQRYQPGIQARLADLHDLYNSTHPEYKLQLLARYGVEYVIVGQLERTWRDPGTTRLWASEAGLATFAAMVGNGLEVAFQDGDTVVYRVGNQ